MSEAAASPAPRFAPRVFSGIQPSGGLTLGNYLGALKRFVAKQDEGIETIYCLVDLHAITVWQDPATLRANTREAAAGFIAAGIDPEHSTLFVQSHVRAHAELAWVLNTITGFGEASRMTQFKDKSSKGGVDAASVGLFTYPILQAADILLYDAAAVPVGEDQRQHIELTRDLAGRFNTRFGDTLVVPEVRILKETAKIYDLQNPGSKMSKSGDSPAGILWLMDDEKTLTKKIKSAVTDSDGVVRFDPAEKPGVSNLLSILAIVSGRSVPSVEADFEGLQYGALKGAVAEAVVEEFRPIRERTAELLDDPAELDRLLAINAGRAEEIADATLRRVYDAVGFLPRG